MGHQGGATTRQVRAAGIVASVALVVASVPTVSAGAAARDETVLVVRMVGAGAADAPVVVRAVRNDGTLGAAQVGRVVDSGSTDARGSVALRADPAALAAFADGSGVVNFESQVLIDGAPRFASFSRRWNGIAWADRDTPAASAPGVVSTAEPAPAAEAAAPPRMSDVTVPQRAAKSEVPCYWYDDSAGDAATKIGELHTGANTSGYFTYGTSADSDISVGYNYGSGWSLGGTSHVGNAKASYIRFNEHSNFHRQLKSDFKYVHWHLTLGPSCASSKRFGKRYYKVTPASWELGSAAGAAIRGPFCTSASGRKEFRRNGDYYRGENRSYTYGGAANAWGAALNATSGYSKFVDMNWHFGSSKKVHHFLCGRPSLRLSKIVYAR